MLYSCIYRADFGCFGLAGVSSEIDGGGGEPTLMVDGISESCLDNKKKGFIKEGSRKKDEVIKNEASGSKKPT